MKNALRELLDYRELIVNFVVRDLKIRYKNSFFGFLWSLLNPLFMMLIFTFVFSHVFKLGIKNFPIFLLTGLFAWNYFNMAVSGATASVVANSSLVRKVHFPREALPISAVLAELVNFCIALILLFIFLVFYGYNFYLFIPLAILVILIQTVFTIGLSLFLAAINVYFRDIQYIVGVFLLALFYASPVLYDVKMLSNVSTFRTMPWLMTVYKLNPIAAFMVLYRDLLYNNVWPSWQVLLYVAVLAVAMFFIGLAIFRKMAPAFAEEM